ncbi:MAG: YdcF family protein [Treponema sp.]|nr:YdcF family protein [Treponema sp.]
MKAPTKIPRIKKWALFLLVLFFLGVLGTALINLGIIAAAGPHVYTRLEEIPPREAILVLGSQTHGNQLSPVLQDRVDAGILLVSGQRGAKILLSGDHGKEYYDEVHAMWLYVLAHGPEIPQEDIFLDQSGLSTWDSVYRAREVFEVQGMIIVTQGFHISRAVAMARSLGLDAVGYSLPQERFRGRSLRAWQTREYFARVKALYSIVFRPKPQGLEESYPISGDGRSSWIGE